MLNQTTEHAIRALLFLAGQPAGSRVTADRIARAIGAPRNYLGKTLQVLARRGILSSARGSAGGFRLELPASRITLAAVASPFSEARENRLCLLGDRPCDVGHPCPAHARWTELQAQLTAPLHRVTIEALLGSGTDPGDAGAAARTAAPAPAA